MEFILKRNFREPLQTWYTIMYVILISCIHKNFWDILTVLWKNIEIFPCEFTSHVDMHAVLYKDTELILQEDKVWKMENKSPIYDCRQWTGVCIMWPLSCCSFYGISFFVILVMAIIKVILFLRIVRVILCIRDRFKIISKSIIVLPT